MTDIDTTPIDTPDGPIAPDANEADFDVNEHQIPWFLGILFFLIVMWAGVAWIPLFGY